MDCQYFHLSFLFYDSFYDLFYATNMTRGNKNAFDVIARFMGCRRLKFFFRRPIFVQLTVESQRVSEVVRAGESVSLPCNDGEVYEFLPLSSGGVKLVQVMSF